MPLQAVLNINLAPRSSPAMYLVLSPGQLRMFAESHTIPSQVLPKLA
jgi:hypothetical protein